MNLLKSVIISTLLLGILSGVAISQVFSAVTDGSNPFDLLWEAIENLQTQIDQIELLPGPQGPMGPQGPPGPPGGFGAPDYDSGWTYIDPGDSHDLSHGLGGDESQFFVYMIGRSESFPDPGNPTTPYYYYHQFSGAYWTINEYIFPGQISVTRFSDDTVWDQYRLCIWIVQ